MFKRTLFSLALIAIASTATAQDRFANVKVTAQPVAGSVHMLVGSGGNIGVSAGDDGLLIVDDQFAPLADKITATLDSINDGSVKYVINTHYHGDHTGGNAWLKKIEDATIFSHDNVRTRLASGENVDPASLPVVTYEHGVKFYFNGETINVMTVPPAHTDGDSFIMFESANVLHTGDLFFRDRFPFVDLNGGGNVQGYIDAVNTMIGMIGEDTQVIPGHGALANRGDLQRFVDMIKETYQDVQARKASGMSEDAIVEAGLDEKWKDWSWGFINEERWIRTLYK